MLDRGALGWDLEFYQDGGLLAGVSYGVFDWWSVGISYGGSGLVGSGTPVMNPLPGFEIRFRPLEENIALPAIVLGFSSQGRGAYIPASDRYTYKSPGFFATLSKNYMMLGFLSIHGGVNYSLERADGDRDMNVFFGADKTLLSFVSVVMEYNLALNDNSSGGNGTGIPERRTEVLFRGWRNIRVLLQGHAEEQPECLFREPHGFVRIRPPVLTTLPRMFSEAGRCPFLSTSVQNRQHIPVALRSGIIDFAPLWACF